MEKTVLEKQFEKVIINHICSLDVTPEVRAKIFVDFHENEEEYYDNLCDVLYAVSTNAVRAPIWMSHSGMVYASTHKKSRDDFFLLPSSDIPEFYGDLVPQLELIFLLVYRVSSKNSKNVATTY